MTENKTSLNIFTDVDATKCTLWVINGMYVTLNKSSGVNYFQHRMKITNVED